MSHINSFNTSIIVFVHFSLLCVICLSYRVFNQVIFIIILTIKKEPVLMFLFTLFLCYNSYFSVVILKMFMMLFLFSYFLKGTFIVEVPESSSLFISLVVIYLTYLTWISFFFLYVYVFKF